MSSEIALPYTIHNSTLYIIYNTTILHVVVSTLPIFCCSLFFHLFFLFRFSFKMFKIFFVCVIFAAKIDFHVSIDAKHSENLIKNWLYMVQLSATTTLNHSFYHNLFFISFALHRPAIQFFSLLNLEYFTFNELHSKLKV